MLHAGLKAGGPEVPVCGAGGFPRPPWVRSLARHVLKRTAVGHAIGSVSRGLLTLGVGCRFFPLMLFR